MLDNILYKMCLCSETIAIKLCFAKQLLCEVYLEGNTLIA